MTITEQPIIDTDIHNTIPSLETLYPYLPDFWCDYIDESAYVAPDANDYPAGSPCGPVPVRTRRQALRVLSSTF